MGASSYTLIRPHRRSSFAVFSSPHSGRDYPESLRRASVLDDFTLRSSEDAFVEELFDMAPILGAPLIAARVPRAFVDLNRAADELDPALIEGVRKASHNPRISSGLGVVPRVVANGRAIYRGKMSLIEAQDRIGSFWYPYHVALKGLMQESCAAFGQSVLIDCHSMPHEALDIQLRPGQPRPDVVLGDRFGAAAGRDIVDLVEAAFVGAGLRVVRNAPFAGAYITQTYGRPSQNMHAVQIEIDRSLYMDERRIEKRADFDGFRALVGGVVAGVIAGLSGGDALPMAAE